MKRIFIPVCGRTGILFMMISERRYQPKVDKSLLQRVRKRHATIWTFARRAEIRSSFVCHSCSRKSSPTALPAWRGRAILDARWPEACVDRQVFFVYIMEAMQGKDGEFTPALLLAIGLLIMSALVITQMKYPQ